MNATAKHADVVDKLEDLAGSICGGSKVTLAECAVVMSEAAEALDIAQAMADAAAISAIECHSTLCNGSYPGWMSIKGEPVEDDAKYLALRGLLERDALLPYIVRLTLDQTYEVDRREKT